MTFLSWIKNSICLDLNLWPAKITRHDSAKKYVAKNSITKVSTKFSKDGLEDINRNKLKYKKTWMEKFIVATKVSCNFVLSKNYFSNQ
jgi:hypothetical protein